MKKNFWRWIVYLAGLLWVALPSFGQGRISLDNYNVEDYRPVTYGSSFDASLAGRGVFPGSPTGVTWTVGLYYALGDVTGSIANDPGGVGDPSTLGGGLALAFGAPGDTASHWESGLQGIFDPPPSDAVIDGYTSGLITVELVAYSGSSYDNSIMRGHSPPFTMTPILATGNSFAPKVGDYMPSFAVNIVPEPSVFALAGIGSALFLFFRRKQV